jgi:hypothetical protein
VGKALPRWYSDVSPNPSLQQTAAVILALRSLVSLSAAAAELVVSI